ncbi:MAG: VOC family protein [Pseudomonadales bacterium]|nr:VOC family protein [Pseudomonadales bacterium]
MIGYTTLGTNDIKRAGKFYDELLSEIDAKRVMADDHIILWSTKPGAAMLGVITPNDEKPAQTGNGTMTALLVKDLPTIERMYAKALELGGTDEGEPGPRGEGGMCFAYCRDLDGNKIAFYCMT